MYIDILMMNDTILICSYKAKRKDIFKWEYLIQTDY